MSKITNIIAELSAIESSLLYREKLLDTVSEVAQVLLTSSEAEALAATKKGMEIVGKCLNTDRVQIWRNEMINGELHFVMRYEWLSAIGEEKKLVPLGLKFPYSSKPGWLEMFKSGKAINSKVSDLSPEDAAFLGYYEMVSIVCLPMFINQELIGFFSVDDCVKPRVFTNDEMKMMGSTGLMFASVFNRVEQAETLKRRENLLQSVNRATHFMLNTSAENFTNALHEAMRVIAQAIKVDRVFIFKNFKIDGIPHCTQVHEWVAAGIESMTGSPLATDVSYYDSVPLDWHEQFNRGEIVHGLVSAFPEKARNYFIPGDVISTIFVPVFKDSDFWGFIGFDDCANERHFTKDEAEILRTFGFLFMNAMDRGKKGGNVIADGSAAHMGKRVLLVEDVELNRDIVKALLADSGIIIDCVENGNEALSVLLSENVKYDMVLMDLAMPVMDGFEATRRIRKKYPIAELPIIALTGNITMEIIDQCNAVGMNDFISKPIEIDKFFALLRNATAHKS